MLTVCRAESVTWRSSFFLPVSALNTTEKHFFSVFFPRQIIFKHMADWKTGRLRDKPILT